jgi:hypothetical protein
MAMARLHARLNTAFLLVALLTEVCAGGSASAQDDVHRYLRWRRNGQLDYRRLLQRYESVSSFPFGGRTYGYPYSAYGGLRQPRYFYHSTPNGVYVDGPYYIGSPYDVTF